MTVPAVYEAISAVQGELARVGISKSRTNAQQHYSFRGIDDVYPVLSPMLAKHKLAIIQRTISREVTQRQTQRGGVLYFVTVLCEFDFCSAVDGSKHTASAFGEASDTGDKATNKAMSAAYKYNAFLTFGIPTEGENDADAFTPEPTVMDDAMISAAQLATLQKTIEDYGRDTAKFCEFAQIEALPDLPVSRFEWALAAIKQAAANAQKKAA